MESSVLISLTCFRNRLSCSWKRRDGSKFGFTHHIGATSHFISWVIRSGPSNLMNLQSNAIKFTETGTISLSTTLLKAPLARSSYSWP